MDCGLNGRTYIVTGASGGLGLATAKVLAADGADLVIASRDQERIAAAAEQLPTGANVRAVAADLADPQTPARLIAVAKESFGRLDGAVVSVGGPPAGKLGDTTEEQWRAAFDSVFLGGLRMARAVLDEPFEPEAQMAVTMVLSPSAVVSFLATRTRHG